MKTSFAVRPPRSAVDAVERGVDLGRRGDWRRALPHFRNATKLAPRLAPAWINLATTLAMLDELGGTERAFCQAIALAPREPSYATRYGWWLVQRGRLDDAEQAFEHARRLAPRDPGPAAGLAGLLERRGRLEQALELLAAHADGADPRVAELGATLCRRLAQPERGLAGVERALRAHPNHPGLHFAHAQLLHALARHDHAFAAWSRANAARGWTFDPAVLSARVSGLLQAFATPEHMAAGTDRDQRPVFLCGMPRSGTSLAEQILGCHPEIHPAGERETLRQIARSLPERTGRSGPWWTCLDALTSADLDELGGRYLAGQPTHRRVIDKMPMNVFLLGLVARILPGARVVICERDGLDAALSCFQQDFAGMAFAWSTSLTGCAARLEAVRRLTAHWRSVLPLPVHVLNYERLVTGPEAEIRALSSFLGVPFHAACLHPERSERLVHTASYAQVRRPIHAGAVGKARPYRAHLGAIAHLEGV